MKSLFIIFTSIIITITVANGQGNQKYIEKEIANLEKLIKKGKFLDGYIYTANDSLKTKLLTFRGKRKKNYHIFCVSKNSNDSIIIYKASDILGYKIEETNFVSHYSNGCNIFLRQLKAGAVDLYEKTSIPSDRRFLYYLRFSNDLNYLILNPEENNVTEQKIPDSSKSESSGATRTYYKSNGLTQKFKMFVAIYFKLCPDVVNRVDSGFYTINDMSSIVEMYNNCDK